MLIRHGKLPDGRIADIRVDERSSKSPTGSTHWTRAGGRRGRGRGAAGLHDHHLHLRAMAAALGLLGRASAGPDESATGTGTETAEPGPDGWIRAVGYHASVAGELDREQLDAFVADTPVRISTAAARCGS